MLSKHGGFMRLAKQVLTLVLHWLCAGMRTILGEWVCANTPKAIQPGALAPLRPSSMAERRRSLGAIVWALSIPPILAWPAASQKGGRIRRGQCLPRGLMGLGFYGMGQQRISTEKEIGIPEFSPQALRGIGELQRKSPWPHDAVPLFLSGRALTSAALRGFIHYP